MASDELKLNKLIKNGIRLTDAFFDALKKRVTTDIKSSKDLEEFLARTDNYTTGNAFISSGYADNMKQLILNGLDTRKLRARQRELFLTTVDYTTTELISNVGEEAKVTIREIAKMGYQTGKYNPTQIAGEVEPVVRAEYGSDPELINKVRNQLFKKYGDSIDMESAVNQELDRLAKTRARTIARTEIKRSQTIADYVSSKDAGCTHFRVSCMNSACPICLEDYTDKEFTIDQIDMLPPRHCNCRCIALFYDKKLL